MTDDQIPTSGAGRADDGEEFDADVVERLRGALLVDGSREPSASMIERLREAAVMKQMESESSTSIPNDEDVGTSNTISSASDATVVTELAPRRSWVDRPLLLAAAAAIIVGVGVGAVLARSLDSESAVEEALADGVIEYRGLLEGGPGSADLEVVRTGVGRVISLSTTDLAILPKGEFYEVWFVGSPDAGGAEPARISVGTFHPDQNGESNVIFTGAVDPALLPIVEVTAEPGDGDPRPGGPVVLTTVIPPVSN